MLVEALPQLVDRRARGFCTDIKKNTNIGLDERPKRVEEPSVTVQLLLVLLLQAENNLHGTCSLRDFTRIGHNDVGREPTRGNQSGE